MLNLRWRPAGVIILAALILLPWMTVAQEETDRLDIVGSGVVAPLFTALAEANETPFEVDVTGTSSGLEALCAGEADVALANRPISIEEDGLCDTNEVAYLEILLGHNILTFIAHPEVDFAQCLTGADLNTLLPPSATTQLVNWNQLNPEYPDTPLSLVLPQINTPNNALLDDQVEGVGVRSDVERLASDDAIMDAVSTTPGALGVVSLSALDTADADVQVLQIDIGAAPGCAEPSAGAVESRAYGMANRLFAYVNADSLNVVDLALLLSFAASAEAAPVVTAAGFTAPSETALETSREILANADAGRQFTREVTAFTLPPDVFGQVGVGGTAFGIDFSQGVTEVFSTAYPNATLDVTFDGEPASFRRLCNGEIDIAFATGDLPEEDRINCDANNITTTRISVGSQAVVLVANEAASYLECLTTDQLATIWGSESNEVVTSWDQVDESFPAGEMFLFAPNPGTTTADLLLITATGVADPGRTDLEFDDDPLYRAAATGNVETALTFMSYPEYLDVLENEQANIQVVAVDAGAGCVTPTEETITDGSYPLSETLSLIVNEAALARLEVQSLLWFMFTDENYQFIEAADLVGLDFGALPELRNTLEDTFAQAEAAALAASEAAAEATPEPTEAATPEADIAATEAAAG